MVKVITAPQELTVRGDIFLGGGISNCPDWQQEIIDALQDTQLILVNPRRAGVLEPEWAEEQIEWEYNALRKVNTVIFWFPEETLCPITLLELGVFTQKPETRIIVGTHPNYERRFDVIKQLKLARPEVEVVDSIPALIENIYKYY